MQDHAIAQQPEKLSIVTRLQLRLAEFINYRGDEIYDAYRVFLR